MKRNLSSSLTLYFKVLLPCLWLIFLGLNVIGTWPGNDAGTFSFIAVWILGTAFLYWYCVRLKRISIDSKFLYVSNYLKEIAVPLSDIRFVTENKWVNIHPVTIDLHSRSGFGNKIIFMPKISLFPFFGSHPVVKELEELSNIKNEI